jgi:Transcriptional regulators
MEILLKHSDILLKRKENEDARKYAYRVLRKSILELILPPTQKLNVLELSNTLCLSRTPVNDTITTLSRDRLVRLVPKKGAYVAGFDPHGFEQSIWMQKTFGSTAIQNIFLKGLKPKELTSLSEKLEALNACIAKGKYTHVTKCILDYYHELYILSGNMDTVWESLIKFSSDFQRILYWATNMDRDISFELYMDLSHLTDAIIHRQRDQAHSLFERHLAKILTLLEPIKKHKPEYLAEN